jgi:CHAT domain-containing protein
MPASLQEATQKKAGAVKQKNSWLTPLLIDHEIVILPSASTLAILRRNLMGRQRAPKTVAIIADPVFSREDGRVSAGDAVDVSQSPNDSTSLPSGQSSEESGWHLQRLFSTRWEADQIASLVSANESLHVMDFSANRSLVTSGTLAQYRILHFATHTVINNTNPELSGIVLSLVSEQGKAQDGFLRAHDLFNLKLPVELVVLSACQTGLGKPMRGEGLLGLTRSFMYAGAPRVVASLWDVDDQATANLMASFYRHLLRSERTSATAALRAAQIEMWNKKEKQSPYFWAAFIMQGEWR